MPEKTLVIAVDYLPGQDGRDWRWVPDMNVLLVSDQLDGAARRAVLEEVSAVWRRSFVRLVGSSAEHHHSCPQAS